MRETEAKSEISTSYIDLEKDPSDELKKGARPMKSARQFPLVALAAVALSARAWAQGQGTDYSKIDITAEKVAPNLYMLSGSAGLDPGHQDAAGGRIGVLAGPDGIFMVDAQYAQLTEKVLAAIRQISPAPIRFMANTHL